MNGTNWTSELSRDSQGLRSLSMTDGTRDPRRPSDGWRETKREDRLRRNCRPVASCVWSAAMQRPGSTQTRGPNTTDLRNLRAGTGPASATTCSTDQR